MTLTKVHNAANEQATLNAPTERRIVQRLDGELGIAIVAVLILEVFIVAINLTLNGIVRFIATSAAATRTA
jgi:hypothetical protein